MKKLLPWLAIAVAIGSLVGMVVIVAGLLRREPAGAPAREVAAPEAPRRPVPTTGDPLGTDAGAVERDPPMNARPHAELGGGDSTGGGGTIDANAVARIIRGQVGGVRDCFERELAHDPTLAGRLEMKFTIGESGRITRIEAQGPLAQRSPAVASCVGSRLRGLVFPLPQGGAVELTFPFSFAPAS